MLIDSHCHLDFEAFDQDRQATLTRAKEAGVIRIVNPAIDLVSSRKIVSMVKGIPEVYAAVGVHPNSATSWDVNTLDELRKLSKEEKVVAIGEIGIDYYRDRAPRSLQIEIFQKQLDLAKEAALPVIIHTRNQSKEDRRAGEDVLAILKDWRGETLAGISNILEHPGVLHSFSDTISAAHRGIELGFYIGITGPVTFKNAPGLQSLVADLSIDNLLIETDSPFLTPHPYRGKRNEPAYVRLVADKIADIHNLGRESVASITTANAERLFKWRAIH